MLGGRFDSFDITVVDVDDAVTTSRKDEEFSPRAGIILNLRRISFFVSYESFLLNQASSSKAICISSTLDPDVFENTEVGFKWDIQDDLSPHSHFDNAEVRRDR